VSKAARSREWLDRILAGEVPDAAALVRECPAEDLYLDYKAGKELEQQDKANATVREYVAAFANSAGGILVLGYDEGASTFDGVKPAGLGTPYEWTTRAIAPVASYLLPPPQIHPVKVGGAEHQKDVIVIATRRSPRLVPVRRGVEDVYMLRLGDSTIPWNVMGAPHYLATDLLTGRRSAPQLDLARVLVRVDDEYVGDAYTATRYVAVKVSVDIENQSLIVAEDVRVGLIVWGEGVRGERPYGKLSPSDSLKAMVDISQPEGYRHDAWTGPRWELSHIPTQRRALGSAPLEIGAFEVKREALIEFVTPIFPRLPPGEPATSLDDKDWEENDRAQRAGQVFIQAALYLMSRNSEPRWYQLGYGLDEKSVGVPHSPLVKPMYERPVVSVRFVESA
jgi:schlafen family protein